MEKLNNNVLMLKIQLAIAMEQLVETGQMNFAKRLYGSLQKLYSCFDEMKNPGNTELLQIKTETIAVYLKEIEDTMLACKFGINLAGANKILDLIKELKPSFPQETLHLEAFGKS